MRIYEENRKQIHKKLYEINTTLDKVEVYNKIVDYILNISEKAYRQGINDIQHWEVYTEEWNEKDTIERLIAIGVKPELNG